ncbi:MAG: sporulation protein YqfD [Syntrophomonas sp.]|nr:sporulation protein YqfD [Syntrophomonas sp.]
MANKFSDQMGGFISLRLRGANQEKIINLVLARGIYIWDIKKRDDCIYLKVRNSGYEAFKTIAAEQNFEIELLKRQGLPFYKKIMKRRMGLFGGAALFIITLYIMSSFVWFIQVSGNDKVDRNKILMTAAHHGIYVGANKWNFSRIEVEEAMLREINEISYIECDIRGVKANIKVVEKILPDLAVTGPCHLVAKRDGVVEDVLVLDGQASVKAGDVVVQGDILISGIVYPPVPLETDVLPNLSPSSEPYQVRARGQVKARTWYEGYGECQLKVEDILFSGQKFTNIYLESPWGKYLLKGRAENPYAIYEQSEKIWHGPLKNWGLYCLKTREQVIKTTEYSESEAIDIAQEKAMQNLRQGMEGNLKIVDSHIVILSSPSDSIVRIKVCAESIEDISLPQSIEGGQISN